MIKTLILLFLIPALVFLGCKKKESINHLTPSEIKERQEAWDIASPVTNSRQILGKWKATIKDMPVGSNLVEWIRIFDKEGNLVESIALSDMATGPVVFYRVKNSRLYISDSPNDKSREEGEIRLKGKQLYIKTSEGIYVFWQIQ